MYVCLYVCVHVFVRVFVRVGRMQGIAVMRGAEPRSNTYGEELCVAEAEKGSKPKRLDEL